MKEETISQKFSIKVIGRTRNYFLQEIEESTKRFVQL